MYYLLCFDQVYITTNGCNNTGKNFKKPLELMVTGS